MKKSDCLQFHGKPYEGTPLVSIRRRCLDCRGGSRKDVRECQFTNCPLHPYRLGRRPPKGTAARTPLRSIRAFCLSCMNGQPGEIRRCDQKSCPFWPFRMGKRPKLPLPGQNEIFAEMGSKEGSFEDREPVRAVGGRLR